ncbi:MAG: polysaccharide pyruvyl transferase family protein [Comamonadaceae bacterium]|nr:polysaccharide pyruvyl transferase family protein [Comamonadaceae bacterium]
MKEVSIIAATFYGNRGAEAMLSATMAEIKARYAGALRFNVFSYYPAWDAMHISDSDVAVYSATPAYLVLVLLPCAVLYRLLALLGLKTITGFLPKSVRALARSKMLICLAGVSFVEGREKFLLFNIATILPAMLLGVTVIKFAQAMGPFGGFVNRLAARFFLSHCAQIFTRGERTHAHLKELLTSRLNYERADDVAFLFKPEYCLSIPRKGLEKNLVRLESLCSNGRLVVGVCPSVVVAKRARASGWDYAQSIAKLIGDLVGKGYVVALYPNATRGEDMDKTHNNDLPLLDDVERNLLPETARNIVKFTGSLNAAQIHKVINACDVHLVSRFHAMVAALSSGVPVLVIGWSHKYLEVMECFSQEDMVFDYKRGGHEAVSTLLDRLLDDRVQRTLTIVNALSGVKRLSQRQVDYAVEYLRKSL